MLKDICLTPQVFDSQHLDNTNAPYLKILLQMIKRSGYIVGLNNKEWIATTLQTINDNHKLKNKDMFIRLIDNLKKVERIVGQPKGKTQAYSENEWILISNELNKIRQFYARLATESFNEDIFVSTLLEEIDIGEKFGMPGGKHYLKTEETFIKVLAPLLSYSKKIVVIDPYFNVSKKTVSQDYRTTLDIIARYLGERRGNRDPQGGTIIIHRSSKDIETIDLKVWQKVIIEIYNKYKHIVTIKVWKKGNRELNERQLHERYIISTDKKIGMSVGAGLDISELTESEFNIKESGDLDEIVSQYNNNNSVFDLFCTIAAKSIDYT